MKLWYRFLQLWNEIHRDSIDLTIEGNQVYYNKYDERAKKYKYVAGGQ